MTLLLLVLRFAGAALHMALVGRHAGYGRLLPPLADFLPQAFPVLQSTHPSPPFLENHPFSPCFFSGPNFVAIHLPSPCIALRHIRSRMPMDILCTYSLLLPLPLPTGQAWLVCCSMPSDLLVRVDPNQTLLRHLLCSR